MHLFKSVIVTLSVFLFFTGAISATCKSTVLVCYGKIKPQLIKGYHYVILESEYYTKADITLIKANNKIVLSYISLGEVNANAEYYNKLEGHVYKKNEIWNSYYLNLNSPKIQQILFNVIENKLEKGFDGLFLDNVDNYDIYGKQSNQKQDLIFFLKELRNKYPTSFFMQNAGLQIVNYTNKYINAIAFESVASNYDLKTNMYRIRGSKAYYRYMSKLNELDKKYDFPIILIEYADDYQLHRKIKTRVAKTNWPYFIGKIDLQTITDYSKN